MDSGTLSTEEKGGDPVAAASPVVTSRPGFLSVLSSKRGRIVVMGVAAGVLLLPALLVAVWWAAVPLISLAGVVSWKRRYWLAGLAGGIVGLVFWLAELFLLPQGAVPRLTDALAGAEGFSPSVMLLIGPLLFGLVTALGALTVAGFLRAVRISHA